MSVCQSRVSSARRTPELGAVYSGTRRTMARKKSVRRPGVEPGSTAWKATMLTVTPPTLEWEESLSFIPYKVGHSIRIRYFPHGHLVVGGGEDVSRRVLSVNKCPHWTMYLLQNNNKNRVTKLCEIRMLGLFSTKMMKTKGTEAESTKYILSISNLAPAGLRQGMTRLCGAIG